MAQLNYATVGSNKLEEAKTFYNGLLGSIGMKPMYEHPRRGRLHRGAPGVFRPYDKKQASVGNGTMAGFGFDTREEVDAFHAKAIELGGVCEGPPGERAPTAYFAYFRDLDGNKICGYKIE